MSYNLVDPTTGDLTLVAGGTLWADSPIGTILAYGGTSAPSGWFLCQGQAISRTTYSELFAVIGTAFGSGDGSTTFNLPDMRESVPKGAGLTGHTVGAHLDADGLAIGEFLDDRIQEHNHRIRGSAQNLNLNFNTDNTSGGIASFNYKGSTAQNELVARNIFNGRAGETTEVKSVGVNYIIKAKMVAMPSDFMSKVDEAVEEVMADIGTFITNEASVHPTTLGSNFNICTLTITAGTWLLVGQSGVSYTGNGYYNFGMGCNGISQTNRASEYNGGGVSLAFPITVTESKTVTAYGYGNSNLVSDSSHTQRATLWAIRIK